MLEHGIIIPLFMLLFLHNLGLARCRRTVCKAGLSFTIPINLGLIQSLKLIIIW